MNTEEKAKSFICNLSSLTDKLLKNKDMKVDGNSEMKALKELFDSFAIIDEFTDFCIIDCYNEIKISLMK